MSYQQTSQCPHCGAPIYVESPWWGTIPPPPIYTCNCTNRNTTITTNTLRWNKKKYFENKLTDEITENNRLRHELSIAEKQIEELVKSIK